MTEQTSTTMETNNVETEEVVVTSSQALLGLIDEWDSTIKNLKGHLSELRSFRKEVISLEKELAKRSKTKGRKRQNNGENKKPSGFAVPTTISEELADFLGIDRGVEVARTEVTKRLNVFIKENDLKNPDNKRIIVLTGPAGEKLKTLLSPLVDDEGAPVVLTFFNIQKFIKHHFPRSKANQALLSVKPVVVADTTESAPVAKKIKKKVVKKSREEGVVA